MMRVSSEWWSMNKIFSTLMVLLVGCACPHRYYTEAKRSQIRWPETQEEIDRINYQLRRELDLEQPCSVCSQEGAEFWHSKKAPHFR